MQARILLEPFDGNEPEVLVLRRLWRTRLRPKLLAQFAPVAQWKSARLSIGSARVRIPSGAFVKGGRGPTVEATDLKSVRCEFESRRPHVRHDSIWDDWPSGQGAGLQSRRVETRREFNSHIVLCVS